MEEYRFNFHPDYIDADIVITPFGNKFYHEVVAIKKELRKLNKWWKDVEEIKYVPGMLDPFTLPNKGCVVPVDWYAIILKFKNA